MAEPASMPCTSTLCGRVTLPLLFNCTQLPRPSKESAPAPMDSPRNISQGATLCALTVIPLQPQSMGSNIQGLSFRVARPDGHLLDPASPGSRPGLAAWQQQSGSGFPGLHALMVISLTSRSLAAAQASRRGLSPAAQAARARLSSASHAARASASAAAARASLSCNISRLDGHVQRA